MYTTTWNATKLTAMQNSLQQPVGRNHRLSHILQDRMSLECEFVFVVLNELLLKLWEEEGYLYMYTHADGFVFRKALVVKPCL